MTHRLDFGSLDLVNADGRRGAFWFEALADGFSLGSPEAVRVVAESLMRDGDDSRIARYGNRVVTFTVQVCGPDGAALAEGERVLALECAGRNELAWTPPAEFGATTVFDVLNATLDPLFDDLGEMRPGVKHRAYTLTLECQPFGRSPEPVTQTFIPSSTSPTMVDDAASSTKWSAHPVVTSSGSVTVAAETYSSESVVKVTVSGYTGAVGVEWTAGTAASMPTTEYVAIDLAPRSGMSGLGRVQIFGHGSYEHPVGSETVAISGRSFTRYYFRNPYRAGGGRTAAGSSVLYFYISPAGATEGVDVVFDVANLWSANATGQTSSMTIEAHGSVRAPMSLRYDGTGRSGAKRSWVLFYSDPVLLDGFSPAVQSTWAAAPDGTYVLYAMQPWTSAVVGDVLAVTVTDAAGRTQTVTTRLTARSANRTLWPIGELQLGGFETGTVGALTLSATRNGTASSPTAFRLFRKHPDASLTYLDTHTTATGTTKAISSRRFLVDAPSLDRPQGGIFIDGAAAFHHADPFDFPMVVPPVTAVYVEDSTATSLDPTTATYHPRFHTYNAYRAP